MEQKTNLLHVESVGKDFDGNVVLKDISFTLNKGEILGLAGENGAGKSTLMNILFGMSVIHENGGYSGNVFFDGQKINFKNPVEALRAGIGMVHQEFSLIPGFTVTENILLNMEKTKSGVISRLMGKTGKKLEVLDKKTMTANAQTAIDTLGVHLDPNSFVSDMPVGHKQFIEIAREINKDVVKLIILDEPTAVLTESEAEILLSSLRKLSQSGVSIILISHRLRELIDICDKIVVMRDGLVVSDKASKDTDVIEIAKAMVGRDMAQDTVENLSQRKDVDEKDILMALEHLWVDMPGETIRDVNLDIRRGEILGIGGLAGQGKLGIPNGIMGLYGSGGKVTFDGNDLPLNDPLTALKRGIAFVSEDRRGVGLLLDEPIAWNIAFNTMQVQNKGLKKVGPFRFRDDTAMNTMATSYIEQLEIKCTGPSQKARNLSGGNQQKVCLSKAFAMDPQLLLVSEPTRGIDVGAKKLVLDALRRYNAEKGTTVVIISSELEELRSISDRIAIVCEGSIAGILSPDTSVEKFGLLMAGESIGEVGEEK